MRDAVGGAVRVEPSSEPASREGQRCSRAACSSSTNLQRWMGGELAHERRLLEQWGLQDTEVSSCSSTRAPETHCQSLLVVISRQSRDA